MKKLIKLCKRSIAVLLFRIMCLFPLKNNRIFFQSYDEATGFTDNPKYLCQTLHEKYPGCFEYIFAFNKNARDTGTPYIKKVRYRSMMWRYYLATSKTVVWNTFTPLWLARRKDQLVINTWHAGGAFKRTGIFRISENSTQAERKINQYIRLFSSSSRIFSQYNIIEGMRYHGEILPCGMPRNDILFSQEAVRKCSEKIRRQYDLGDACCVLFAPTYRGNGEIAIDAFPPLADVVKTLRGKTGRDVIMLLRKHRMDKNKYEIPGITVDVSSYPDTQELLCCAEVLITDYSSIIWDFALLGRPCFLFAPDCEVYEKSRGLFTSLDDWPGILCHDGNELLREIKEMDEKRSHRIAEQYLDKAGSYEQGNAAKMLAERIFQHMTGQTQV